MPVSKAKKVKRKIFKNLFGYSNRYGGWDAITTSIGLRILVGIN
jgi:hypothetical protein